MNSRSKEFPRKRGGMRKRACIDCKNEFESLCKKLNGLRCPTCKAIHTAQYSKSYGRTRYARLRDEYIMRSRIWRVSNRDRSRQLKLAWNKRNLDTVLECHRLSRKANRGHISDGYLRQVFRARSPLKCKNIPDNILGLLRAYTMLSREIKTQSNEATN